MANAKEIRGQIKSTQNTQKITSAMEMVAASKMRRAEERMHESRPYAEKLREAVGHLTEAAPGYKHPFMVEREETRKVAYVVVSSDRGLCGALNINLFRQVLGELRRWDGDGIEASTVVVGSKGLNFFRRLGNEIIGEVSGLGDKPFLSDLVGSAKVAMDAYKEGKVDRVYLAHNSFVNTMSQKPVIKQLLPTESFETTNRERWDYIYEPAPEELLDHFLTRYVEAQIYGAVRENVACEMAARMVAMKSASDNAGQIIDDLQLQYNKARQAAITQELSEIVGGAAAV